MQRQLNERTEKLGIMGDSMERLEGNSAGWADDVSKFVGKQKKNLIMGGEFRFFFLLFYIFSPCCFSFHSENEQWLLEFVLIRPIC